VYFVPRVMPQILNISSKQWPGCLAPIQYCEASRSYLEAFLRAVAKAWCTELDHFTEERVVGEVNGEEIVRDVTVLVRQGTSESER
jgi:hypothetical protein